MKELTEEISDEKIIKLVLKGDTNAFGFLVNRFEKKLGRYIRRFVFSQSDAEDILQNVFIKAYTNIRGFNFNYKFSSWIYRIAHNEVVNYIRGYKKNIITNIDWDILFPVDMSKNDMVDELEKEFLEKWLKENLKILDKKYKEVLVLYYFEEMSYKDIADILKIPVATVGVRLKRAKSVVKNNYDKNIKNKK